LRAGWQCGYWLTPLEAQAGHMIEAIESAHVEQANVRLRQVLVEQL
jgi:hypothetical protein